MKTLLHDQTHVTLDAITEAASGSYIFHGAPMTGKATTARELAQRLNCQGDTHRLCLPCRQFAAGTYPDYVVVQPEDKPSIIIEQIRTLSQALALSPYYPASTRLVAIDGADRMTTEAQNALLKLIEEPPPRTVFILITERLSALLPTVRSRCVQIHFPRLTPDAVARLLVQDHGVVGLQAGEIAAVAGGAPGLAIHLAKHPEAAAAQLELARLAAATPAMGRFGRLLLAAQLASAGTDVIRFAHLLHENLIGRLCNGAIAPAEAGLGLEALECFRGQIQAKVAPRVALERLMLEL